MENLDALMVVALYIFLLYEIFLCLRQKVAKDDSKKLRIRTTMSPRLRKGKVQEFSAKRTGNQLTSACDLGRPTRTSSSRHFIQMRILGRR